MVEITDYCLSEMTRVFGENLLLKHNQKQRSVFFQLARGGSIPEMIMNSNGKKFVKSFRKNESLIKRIKNAKSK